MFKAKTCNKYTPISDLDKKDTVSDDWWRGD
jgi:hypothetical protein